MLTDMMSCEDLQETFFSKSNLFENIFTVQLKTYNYFIHNKNYHYIVICCFSLYIFSLCFVLFDLTGNSGIDIGQSWDFGIIKSAGTLFTYKRSQNIFNAIFFVRIFIN